jgi:hypothetical protein
MSKVTVEMDEELHIAAIQRIEKSIAHIADAISNMNDSTKGIKELLRQDQPTYEALLAALRAAKPAGEWEPLANDEVIGIQDAMDIVVGEVRELLYKACGITLDADVELCRRRTEGA